MKITVQVTLEDDQGKHHTQEVIQLEKGMGDDALIGLSLAESKQLLQTLQATLVQQQANAYTQAHRCCPACHKNRRIKGVTTIQYRTLFGTICLDSQRFYQCSCTTHSTQTLSILSHWLPSHVSPELQYMETKWASLMSYGMTVDLLKDVLPIHPALSAETVRKQVHRVAERQDKDIHEEPKFIGGCPNEWENLPKPDKPLVVGIDGGYVKSCEDKKNNFEVIVGKCFSKTQTAKNLGFVQTIDDHSQQRLMHLLNTQGMQANQQVTFLSDGGDTVRA
jgi:hypothetical protein